MPTKQKSLSAKSPFLIMAGSVFVFIILISLGIRFGSPKYNPNTEDLITISSETRLLL